MGVWRKCTAGHAPVLWRGRFIENENPTGCRNEKRRLKSTQDFSLGRVPADQEDLETLHVLARRGERKWNGSRRVFWLAPTVGGSRMGEGVSWRQEPPVWTLARPPGGDENKFSLKKLPSSIEYYFLRLEYGANIDFVISKLSEARDGTEVCTFETSPGQPKSRRCVTRLLPADRSRQSKQKQNGDKILWIWATSNHEWQ